MSIIESDSSICKPTYRTQGTRDSHKQSNMSVMIQTVQFPNNKKINTLILAQKTMGLMHEAHHKL